jgi:hypothetical protein
VEELQRAEELQRSISALLTLVGCSQSTRQRRQPESQSGKRPPPAFLMKKLTEELATLTARTRSAAPKSASGNAWMNHESEWPQRQMHAASRPMAAERVSKGPPVVDDGEWVALRGAPSSLSSLGFSTSR